jgi:hypothetical protein
VGSQHADPALTVRPPAEVKAQAEEILKAQGVQMRAFVVACLKALAADPEAFLAGLAGHWPAPKGRGRPPRNSTPEPAAEEAPPSAQARA